MEWTVVERKMKIPGFMIAAGASGSGKTTITCALIAALQQRGLRVAACKCGPDYIDPMFHREILGVPSENLDLFFCEKDELKDLYVRHTSRAEIAVTEGVMGYYDGMTLESDAASSYDVAKTLGIPVILVVPCKGMALSAAASVLGMLEFRAESGIQGILLNRVSGMLYPRMKSLIESELKKRGFSIPVVGYVPEKDIFRLESRHLGLKLPQEKDGIRRQMEQMGECLSQTIDIEKILEIAGRVPETIGNMQSENVENDKSVPPVRIAVAHDEAFCFYYKENMEILRRLGCELVPFSPLRDAHLPERIQGLLLGGGYPELYAKELAENESMRRQIFTAVTGGLPCIAECGGFLYLQQEIEGTEGKKFPMCGVIEGSAYRTERLQRFGYLTLHAKEKGTYLNPGEEIRAHEFHYWDSTDNGADCLAVKPDGRRKWECVHMKGNLFAGFSHLYFGSHPMFAKRFAARCRETVGKETVPNHKEFVRNS